MNVNEREKLAIIKLIDKLVAKYMSVCEYRGEFSLEAERLDKEILRLEDELSKLNER